MSDRPFYAYSRPATPPLTTRVSRWLWGPVAVPAERAALLVAAAVLLLACCQARFGGGTTDVGEEVGFGVPLATVMLAAGLLAVVWWRRAVLAEVLPPYPALLAVFLGACCLGLLGLNRNDWPLALRNLVQLAELGVAAWLLVAALGAPLLPALARLWGLIGWLLLLAGAARLIALPMIHLSGAKYGALLVLATPFMVLVASTWRWWAQVPALLLLAALAGWSSSHAGLLLVLLAALILTLAWLLPRQAWLALPVVALALFASHRAPHSDGSPWTVLQGNFDATHRSRLAIEADAAWQAPACYPFGSGLGHYKRAINQLRQSLDSPSPLENKVPRDGNNQYLLLLVEAGPLAPLVWLLALLAAWWGVAWRRPADDALAPVAAATAVALLGLLASSWYCVVFARGSSIWVGALLGAASVLRAAPGPLASALAALRRPRAYGTLGLARVWATLRWPAAVASLTLALMLATNVQTDRTEHLSVFNRSAREHWLPLLLGGRSSSAKPTVAVTDGLALVALPRAGAQEDGGVRVEGEAYTQATGQLHKVAANDASGHQALEIPWHSGKGLGAATYQVTLATAGRYELSARVYWHDGCANSLALELGGVRQTVTSEIYNTWHDLRFPQIVTLPAGPVTATVRNTEDGIRLDYFTLRLLPPEGALGTPAPVAGGTGAALAKP